MQKFDDQACIALARDVIRIEAIELERLASQIGNDFVRAIRRIIGVADDGGKIVFVGVGKCANICSKTVATFNSLGVAAVTLCCVSALHGDLGLVGKKDLVVALSYSGETSELLDALPHLIRRSAGVIAVTGNPASTLSLSSEIALVVKVNSEACPLNLAPTASSVNMMAMGDALAMVVAKIRGFSSENFAELHPGGSLGLKLTLRVGDIMRRGAQIALCSPSDPVCYALDEMTRCKSGAAIVVDHLLSLQGIFTHGDFVRSYRNDPHVSGHAVVLYMTRDPISIRSDQLAVDALKLLEKHHIDEVVVTDAARRVVGLLDVQDLSRARLF